MIPRAERYSNESDRISNFGELKKVLDLAVMVDNSEFAASYFTQDVIDMPPYRQEAFMCWLSALGQKEEEAKRIAKLFEEGLPHGETWAEIIKVYGRGKDL